MYHVILVIFLFYLFFDFPNIPYSLYFIFPYGITKQVKSVHSKFIFNVTLADVKTKSADVSLKMVIVSSEMKIA